MDGGDGKPCVAYCGVLIPAGAPVRRNAKLEPECVVCANMWDDKEPARRRWSR
jgi:hypothetical protein